MTGPRDPILTPQQLQVLECLLTGGSVADAAQAAGVSERTVYRWVQMPEFREAFEEQRRATLQRAALRLNRMAEDAADAYADCVQPRYPHAPPRRGRRDNRNPQAIRLATANQIFDRIGAVPVKQTATPEELESTDPSQLKEALKARGFVQLDDLSSDELEALAAKKREADGTK